nr:winged helix-turn-helix domain-containing protein [Streptomyces guryensis]
MAASLGQGWPARSAVGRLGVAAEVERGPVRAAGGGVGQGARSRTAGRISGGTLSRVKTVIGRRFHKSYTLQGVRKLLIRHGFSCQVPATASSSRSMVRRAGC